MRAMKLPKPSFRVNHTRFQIVVAIVVVCVVTILSVRKVPMNMDHSDTIHRSTTLTSQTPGEQASKKRGEKQARVTEILVSKMRGFHKKSMLPFERIGPEGFSGRNHMYQRWMDRCKKGHCSDHLELAFPTCKAFINHHYKFIWIRGTKVGGTALREPLGWVCDDRFQTDGLDVDDTYCAVSLFTNATYEDAMKWWKEYFVFDIVRNPYIRFASGEQYISPKVRISCNETLPFGEVCRSPYTHTQYCLTHDCCHSDVEHHFLHMASQSQCLFDSNLRPVVDYLGETETLEEDTHIIISEINRRRDPSLPPLKALIPKRNAHSSDKPSKNSYTVDLYKNNEHCLETVGDFFQRDFFLLGYEKLKKIPDDSGSSGNT